MTLLLAACSPRPQPLIFGDPVWSDGETSRYQVTNRGGRIVGAATVRIDAGGEHNGGDGWTLRREINDVGAQEEATVEFRAGGFKPVYSYLVRTDSSGSQMVETTIDRTRVDMALTNRTGATVYERVQVPSDIRDERTLLTIVRALPLQEGYATHINSFLPVVGVTERFTVWVRGRETVETPAGTFTAWKVDLKTTDRTTRAWIAVEAPFPVVKFIDGRSRATFELTEFQPGGKPQD